MFGTFDFLKGDKPVYQCELCPTTCGRKTDLRLHVQKLHTSERPMHCKMCGKSFPDRWVGCCHLVLLSYNVMIFYLDTHWRCIRKPMKGRNASNVICVRTVLFLRWDIFYVYVIKIIVNNCSAILNHICWFTQIKSHSSVINVTKASDRNNS